MSTLSMTMFITYLSENFEVPHIKDIENAGFEIKLVNNLIIASHLMGI